MQHVNTRNYAHQLNGICLEVHKEYENKVEKLRNNIKTLIEKDETEERKFHNWDYYHNYLSIEDLSEEVTKRYNFTYVDIYNLTTNDLIILLYPFTHVEKHPKGGPNMTVL